jgi:hypothetical protein
VVTDGLLSDPEFRLESPFEKVGKRWEPIGKLQNESGTNRQICLWRALELDDV